MLYSRRHGASNLYRTFRRSMKSHVGGLYLDTDAMRSTFAIMRGGRAASTASRSLTPPSLHKTWQPTHGIVFNTGPPSLGNQRLSSLASISTLEEDLRLHSAAEDDYVLARMPPIDEPEVLSKETLEQSACKTEPEEAPVERSEPPRPDSSDEIPKTSFTYKMTEELFSAAKNALPQTPESYWLHTLYRSPPPSSDEEEPKKVKVHYCQSLHTTERVISQYFLNQKIVGFDIEWMADANRYAGPKQNVSLIQLASEERIALLHIALYPKDHLSALVAPSLKKLMEDPAITKVGVAIKGDCTRLRNHLSIHSQGLFELSHLYRLVKYSREPKLVNKKLVALATQVQDHLRLPMFKGTDVRSSDWSKKLSMDQITYAAADSYAGIQLYDVMDLKRQALDPTPPLPYHAELDLPIRLAKGVAVVATTAATTTTTEEVADEQEEPEEVTSSANVIAPSTTTKKSKTPKLPRSEVEADPEADPDSAQTLPPIPPASTSTSPTTTTRSKPASKPTTTTTTTTTTPKHPLLTSAEQHVSDYRARTATSTLPHRATAANLRAYFLWIHYPALSIPEIAAVMRTPPLQTATVAGYILEAVKLESLAYERGRVGDVFKVWRASGGGKGVIGKRYWRLERDLE